VLVNYYQPIPHEDTAVAGDSPACLALRFPPGGANRERMRDAANAIVDALNATIARVARRSDVHLVNIRGLFRGHEICTPTAWLTDSPWDAAHPNTTGQCQIAAAVERKLRFTPRTCP
jgi:hypothetical protein